MRVKSLELFGDEGCWEGEFPQLLLKSKFSYRILILIRATKYMWMIPVVNQSIVIISLAAASTITKECVDRLRER